MKGQQTRYLDFYLKRLLKESRKPDRYFTMHGIIVGTRRRGYDYITVASWGGYYNVKLAYAVWEDLNLKWGQDIYLLCTFFPVAFGFVVMGKIITKDQYEQSLVISKERNNFYSQLQHDIFVGARRAKTEKYKKTIMAAGK